MAFIKAGENKTIIGVDEILIYCPSCESSQWSDIMVTGKYFHIYWIPILPVDKELNIICKNCGLKRYGLSFNNKIISNYAEIKNRFSHPWFTYIGICIFIVLIMSIIMVRLLK
jgi:hypothetical protein